LILVVGSQYTQEGPSQEDHWEIKLKENSQETGVPLGGISPD
jgi:hypothetical protein